MNHYFYDGLAGMLLIFYALNCKQQSDEIHKIYVALEKMLFSYTDKGQSDIKYLNSRKNGAYEGEASIVYTYINLYKLSKDNKYLAYAEKHAIIVEKLVDEDRKYDFLSGNSGAAWVLSLLYLETENLNYLKVSEYSVHKLAESAEKQSDGIGWIVENGMPPMAGMAHGNSGVLMPVLTLWFLTGEDSYELLAEQIWKYENSLFDVKTNNWKDLRATTDNGDNIGAVAWCHGAAGILLSRILCYRFVQGTQWEARIKADILTAYEKVKGFWQRDSYSLCHGTLGNLWIMEMSEEKMIEYGMLKSTECLDKQVIWKNSQCIKLLPQEKINPGFMNGYGGILYYMLKG